MVEEPVMSNEKKKLQTENATIYQTNENCQVFNGPISGCVFAMPGATVNQSPVQQVNTANDSTAIGQGQQEQSLSPEEQCTHDEQVPPTIEPPNKFAPKKNLQDLLKGAWFGEVRTDAKYDDRWTDAFVEALMQSEYGEGIARQWAVKGVRGKRTQIKGYVVGLLKDAGVLSGSYDAIAARVDPNDKKRKFSRYMSQGKRQPYSEWVKENAH